MVTGPIPERDVLVASTPMADRRAASIAAAPPIFLGDEENRQINENGHVRTPLVDRAGLEMLQSLHERLHPHRGRGFDTDFAYAAPSHKREVDEGIRAVVEPALARILEPFRLLNVTFVVKWPAGSSELPVHQDWAYVDETEHRCLTFWLPLDQTSTQLGNGPVGVIPRSHRLPAYRRGATSRPWYLPYRDQLGEHLVYPELDPGDALFFDCRMLHGSPPNTTGTVRRAVTAMVTLKPNQLRYHHITPEECRTYEVQEDFFVENGPIDLRLGRPRGARLLVTEPATVPVAPLAELSELCGINLDPLPSEADPSLKIAGTPLGTDLVSAEGARGQDRARLHAAIADLDEGPVLDAHIVPDVASLATRAADLRAAWESSPGAALSSSLDPSGSWPLLTIDDDGDPLRVLLTELVGHAPAWVALGGYASTLPPHRGGHNAQAVAVMALSMDQPPGSVLFQVCDQMEALEPGVPLAFDPTFEHAAWNFGAAEVPVLFVAVERRLPSELAETAAALTDCLPSYRPMGSRAST